MEADVRKECNGKRTDGVVLSIGQAADVALNPACELVVPLPQLLHNDWRPLAWLLAMMHSQLLQHSPSRIQRIQNGQHKLHMGRQPCSKKAPRISQSSQGRPETVLNRLMVCVEVQRGIPR